MRYCSAIGGKVRGALLLDTSPGEGGPVVGLGSMVVASRLRASILIDETSLVWMKRKSVGSVDSCRSGVQSGFVGRNVMDVGVMDHRVDDSLCLWVSAMVVENDVDW